MIEDVAFNFILIYMNGGFAFLVGLMPSSQYVLSKRGHLVLHLTRQQAVTMIFYRQSFILLTLLVLKGPNAQELMVYGLKKVMKTSNIYTGYAQWMM